MRREMQVENAGIGIPCTDLTPANCKMAYRVRAAWATAVLPFSAAVLRLSFWLGPRIFILLVDFAKQGMPREVGCYAHRLPNLMHIFHAHFHA